MNIFQKKMLLFLIGCIGARLLLTYIVYKLNKKYLPYLSIIGFIIGLGFIFSYITKKERGSTFNQKAWWHQLRPIHSAFYLWFAYLALIKNKLSYVPLLIDTIFGLISFLIYHLFKW
tara:strand:+ start:1486 stop:1836 length:351 start_codon:yes stop_codon:yes gene_type:complete